MDDEMRRNLFVLFAVLGGVAFLAALLLTAFAVKAPLVWLSVCIVVVVAAIVAEGVLLLMTRNRHRTRAELARDPRQG